MAITIAETHTNITCNGLTDGTIDLTVTGGTGPGTYIYNWNTPDGSGLINGQEDQNGLGAGTYFVTVTDAGGSHDGYIDTRLYVGLGVTYWY